MYNETKRVKMTTFKLAPEQITLIMDAMKDKRNALIGQRRDFEVDGYDMLIEYFEDSQ